MCGQINKCPFQWERNNRSSKNGNNNGNDIDTTTAAMSPTTSMTMTTPMRTTLMTTTPTTPANNDFVFATQTRIKQLFNDERIQVEKEIVESAEVV